MPWPAGSAHTPQSLTCHSQQHAHAKCVVASCRQRELARQDAAHALPHRLHEVCRSEALVSCVHDLEAIQGRHDQDMTGLHQPSLWLGRQEDLLQTRHQQPPVPAPNTRQPQNCSSVCNRHTDHQHHHHASVHHYSPPLCTTAGHALAATRGTTYMHKSTSTHTRYNAADVKGCSSLYRHQICN